jgi:GAF domain-containing protein
VSDRDRAQAWDQAPCGLLVLAADGTVLDANATFLAWTGRAAADVVGQARLSELLSVGGRIYWETHLAPLLHGVGRVEEVAVELRAPEGRLPVLLDAVVTGEAPRRVHVVLSSARERSRYERELLAARRAADRSATQARVLQEGTAALSGAVGTDAVVEAVLAAVTGPLGGAAATFWSVAPGGGLLERRARGEAPDAAPLPPRYRPDRGAVVTDAGRLVAPVLGQSRLVGMLSVAPRTGPAAEPVDEHVLAAVGQQAGLALDRASLYEQNAEVAHRLQRALLATDVPRDDRFTVTTTYRPGVESLEVGGDWYDTFLVDDDVLAVAVGDVVGRGLGAAIAMGQVRSAVRAIAAPGVGPAALLGHLDRFVRQVGAAFGTTLAYAEVDLASGVVRYACAGHLPPLLLPREGAPHLVWGGRSTPLGVLGPERREAELTLAPGDGGQLYTDGLVERRDRSLPRGLEVLAAAAADVRDLPPADAVPRLATRLLQDERGRDDVCALLLAWDGAPAPG